MLTQQIEHYTLVAGPTVTINIKQADKGTVQYSSWERFNTFRVGSAEVTDSIILKYEFIIRLPNTPSPQRCVINVSLDSGLPIIVDSETSQRHGPARMFGLFLTLGDYKTVEISIDFVDFLIAKVFSTTVEEWFSKLERVPRSDLAKLFLKKLSIINNIVGNFDKIGVAIFFSCYIWFGGGFSNNLDRLVHAASIALTLWGVFSILSQILLNSIATTISNVILPSVIILSDGDERAYKRILEKIGSPYSVLIKLIFTILFGISINIVSSFLYAHFGY